MGIRDTSYYGWQSVNVFPSTPFNIIILPVVKDIAIDSKGNIYAVGHVTVTGESTQWTVSKSVNQGDSWEIIDAHNIRVNQSDQALGIAIDSQDNIYVVGFETDLSLNWIVRKSTTGASGSFFTIDHIDRDGNQTDLAHGVAIDSQDNVYVVGTEIVTGQNRNWIVRKSTTGASSSFSYIDNVNRDNQLDEALAVAIDSQDNVYVVGFETVTGQNRNFVVRKSTTGASGSFSYIDSVNRDNQQDQAISVAIDSQDNVYVVGDETVTGQNLNWIVRKSTTGASGSFSYIDNVNKNNLSDQALGVAVDSKDNVYVVGSETVSGIDTNWIVRRSTGASGSFVYVNSLTSEEGTSADSAFSITIDPQDNIFVAGFLSQLALLRKGKLTPNSASLGPRMLATSFGYVFDEPVSGTLESSMLEERFKLNNLTEFPHSSGIFQMRNIVLGTTDGGQIGKTDDSILQINYVGSVVNVMWPKQDVQKAVKGFGDFAAGQRIGKLSTQFEPGEIVDVTEHDHLALYCYLIKETSGTLDDVEITVERRPLRDTGFATDQTIEYVTSGSVTVAKLRDLRFSKEIDYGDLSIKEIAYPIDVPLENIRELRISARHVNGQPEENKNFIVWGRFIKSEEET